MRFLFRILPVLALSVILNGQFPVWAQVSSVADDSVNELSGYILSKLGSDQNLINGIQYYNRYQGIMNHPYLRGEACLTGSVVISGRRYDRVMINYDIYNQNLILRYENKYRAINKIIIDPAHIDAFSIGNRNFRKLSFGDEEPRLYQLVNAGGITCYIHWRKRKLETMDNLQYAFYFTEPEKSYYLEIEGKAIYLRRLKDMIALFPEIPGRSIRRYVWNQEIRFRDMTTEQLSGLLEFIASSRLTVTGE